MKNKGCLIGLIIAGIFLLFVIIAGVSLSSDYNKMVTLKEDVTKSWSEVENQFQRRMDLIPNLVNTVKGYAKHEKEVFTNIAEARAKLAGAKTVKDKINASNQFEGALSRLLVVVEKYPQLKADKNFTQLMDELSGTENRIAVARKRYNDAANRYNVYIKRFPKNLIASMFNFKEAPYFKAEKGAEKAPKVDFGN